MDEHPEVQWALDLLKPDPNYDPGFLKKYLADILFPITGAGIVVTRNWMNCRPNFAGIQGHIAAMVVGYFVAQIAKKTVNHFHAERDSRLRDYIIRHPELFPEPVRVKYSDIIEEWTPIR